MSTLIDEEALLFSMSSLTTTSELHRIMVCVPIFNDTIGPSDYQSVSTERCILQYVDCTLLGPLLKLNVYVLSRELMQIAQYR